MKTETEKQIEDLEKKVQQLLLELRCMEGKAVAYKACFEKAIEQLGRK